MGLCSFFVSNSGAVVSKRGDSHESYKGRVRRKKVEGFSFRPRFRFGLGPVPESTRTMENGMIRMTEVTLPKGVTESARGSLIPGTRPYNVGGCPI